MVILSIALSILGLCLLMTLLVFSISGAYLKKVYLIAWDQAHCLSYDDPRKTLIAHGILAANGHNSQPWRCVLSNESLDQFDLWLDPKRVSPHVDSDYRQALISMGAMVKYMEVAGRHLGYPIDVMWFPKVKLQTLDPNQLLSIPLATIRYKKDQPTHDPLYNHIFKPDTNRSPYLNIKMSDEVLKRLTEISDTYSSHVRIYQDDENVKYLAELGMNAATIETENNDVMQETDALFRRNEREKNRNPYGFSLEGQGMRGFPLHMVQTLLTLFPAMAQGEGTKQVFLKNTRLSLEHTSSFLIMTSDTLTPEQCLHSGMLYSHLVLTSHDLGFTLQPVSQAIEVYPTMMPINQEIHQRYANDQTIMMLCRIGQPTKKASLSMRLGVNDMTN